MDCGCTTYHMGPFGRSPNERIHGWIYPVWLRCEGCGSDISPDAVRSAVFSALEADEADDRRRRIRRNAGGFRPTRRQR
jgi:hypothetical protein